MQNAQQWLNSAFPTQEQRQKITHLAITGSYDIWALLGVDEDEEEITDTWKKFVVSLEGKLDLNDFTSLQRLYLGGGRITELKIDQCRKLNFLDVSCEWITQLDISNNLELTELKSHYESKPIKLLREKFQAQEQVKTQALTNKLELVKNKLHHWTQLIHHD